MPLMGPSRGVSVDKLGTEKVPNCPRSHSPLRLGRAAGTVGPSPVGTGLLHQ